MLATQTDAVHYFQQPDGRSPARLGAHVADRRRRADHLRQGGRRHHALSDLLQPHVAGLRVERPRLSAARGSAELEQLVSLNFATPALFFNSAFFNFNEWNYWNNAGLLIERAVNTNWHFVLRDNFEVDLGATARSFPARSATATRAAVRRCATRRSSTAS